MIDKSMLKAVIIAVAIVGTLIVVFSKTQIRNSGEFGKIILATTDLTESNGAVLRNIISVSVGHNGSFDALVESTENFERSLLSMERLLHELGESERFSKKLDFLSKLSNSRNDKIEQLKSSTAIVRNSYMQVPDLLDTLDAAFDNPQNRRFKDDLLKLHSALISQIIGQGDPLNSLALNDPKSLLSKVILKDDKGEKQDVVIIATHIDILTKIRHRDDLLINEILTMPIFQSIRELNQDILDEHHRNQERTNLVRWALLLISVTLVPATLYALIAQQKLNESLDSKVEQRTQLLHATNESLQKEIAERILAQKTSEDAQIRLTSSSKFAALGEMAAGIAHEINNPLAVIHMRSLHLQRALGVNPLDTAVLSKYAKIIETTAEHIALIVKGLRSFSRSGDKDSFEAVSVINTLDDTMALCSEKFKHNSIALHVEFPAEDFEVRGRTTQLSQVFLNLLNNSFDAVADLEEKWVRIAIVDLKDQIQITISDSGCGIPENVREKIMQPFFTTKEVGKGTGLGLSISRGIIAEHNGSLTIDPDAQHTSFVITLPKVTESNHIAA